MAGVVVIGGANVDVKGRSHGGFVTGTSNPGSVSVVAGGVARNIAHNLALLGVPVRLFARIGSDANGRLIRQTTEAAGVDCTLMREAGPVSDTYLAIMDGKGELVAAINDMPCVASLAPVDLAAEADGLVAADMLIADCNLSVDCLAWLVDFAARRSIRLVIEPISVAKALKLIDLPTLAGIYAATPNLSQLRAATGLDDVPAAIAALHGRGIANVIVHCGRDGAMVSDGKSPPVAIGAREVATVADVTGAGDAAVAGLVFGLLAGDDLAAAARLGQAAAAIKLQSHSSVASRLDRDSLLRLAGLT
ncbi:MAG: carbohydrate kinase family protein [Rhizobiales bacterium]|nr:carbohydrate kinase family protein [Hyphomicrobiales bacterium]MBI3672045.1 carbohydrate kinase family protein [Hyphomicrobiales bacterium]